MKEENNNINLPETFQMQGRNYSLVSSTTTNTFQIKINGQDISDYLVEGTSISCYDVTSESGTNAAGKTILNVIGTKYRIDLACRYLNDEELIDFYEEIIKNPIMDVEFLNPFTGEQKTIEAYRGDRTANPKIMNESRNLYGGPSITLIEL